MIYMMVGNSVLTVTLHGVVVSSWNSHSCSVSVVFSVSIRVVSSVIIVSINYLIGFSVTVYLVPVIYSVITVVSVVVMSRREVTLSIVSITVGI